jgi:SAM-dependent methyltransferase
VVKATEPGAGKAGRRPGGLPAAGPLATAPDLLTRGVRGYAAGHPGQPVTILLAGCLASGELPDLGQLRADGCELAVSLIDTDDQVARAAAHGRADGLAVVLSDLRTVPLPPRSYDVVACALLDRIQHAELVLDRLVDSVRPGGLLLLRVRDRDCAAGFLDRKLPARLRARAWRTACPGRPGPYPAVYEPLAGARGVQAYVLRRGLVIAGREAVNTLAGQRRAGGWLLARRVVALLPGATRTAAHDELRYVIRKPEDRFARVL